MLIYTDKKTLIKSEEAIRKIEKLLWDVNHLTRGDAPLESSRELLIYSGMFESGICDEMFAEQDSMNSVSNSLREFVVTAGRIHSGFWRKQSETARDIAQKFNDLMKLRLPQSVWVTVPEGYAYYGLYPETYIEAALKFSDETKTRSAVCIGVRSIGTSLSAVVAGTLQDQGWNVETFTVRPRGHPFDRELVLSERLVEIIKRHRREYFLIVDEGPGLSGSSFASVVRCLESLGISSKQIVLFPSSDAVSSKFVNHAAKEVWNTHQKFVCSFDNLFIRGNAVSFFPQYHATDLSAGMWREHLPHTTGLKLPVDHSHERRKFLLTDGSGISKKTYLAKFIGFKPFADEKLRIGSALASAGFSPEVLDYKDGFVLYRFVEGVMLTSGNLPSGALQLFAKYCAFRKKTFAKNSHVELASLVEMINRNTALGLGEEWEEKLQRCDLRLEELAEESICAVDGKMLPHKWILTSDRLLKTDSIDHFSDQFVPGCQDIAWDIAGVCVEFNLNSQQVSELICCYREYSGDKSIEKRLLFYTAVYLSFRLGYAELSAASMKGTFDGTLFEQMRNDYAAKLKKTINAMSHSSLQEPLPF